jgi:hypothetical protein
MSEMKLIFTIFIFILKCLQNELLVKPVEMN